MRATLIAAAALALSMTAGAQAQSQQPAAQQPAAQQSGKQSAPKVTSVSIVDFSELPDETKKKVDEVASKATENDLKGLRNSIDKSPEIKKALAAKGVDSSQVVVANLDQQGTLTLVTRKRG